MIHDASDAHESMAGAQRCVADRAIIGGITLRVDARRTLFIQFELGWEDSSNQSQKITDATMHMLESKVCARRLCWVAMRREVLNLAKSCGLSAALCKVRPCLRETCKIEAVEGRAIGVR